jgi:hypothetical protein
MYDVRIGRLSLLVAVLFVLAGILAAAPARRVQAHPEVCESDHGDGEEHDHGEICFTEEEIAKMDDSGAILAPGEIAKTSNIHLMSNLPKSGPFEGVPQFGSDLAFWGKYAFQGNYNGIQITDITEPDAPKIVSQLFCPGAQNDVSVWGNLIFASVDSSRNMPECERDGKPNVFQSATIKESWEGIRIFDWSNPASPKFVAAVETDCGSHTHTLIPQPEKGRALLYVSSYSPNRSFPDCQPPHDKISIVEVPLANPAAAKVIATPVLFPDGGTPSGTGRQTDGCHDITVYPAIGLAAGACTGQGSIFDISDPVNPREIARLSDPNFAFWHSATFSNDGKTVIFTDELGGGGGPTCNPTIGPKRGADAIYDISNPSAPVFKSYFKIPRTQANTENCVAHNGSVLPTPNRNIFVQAWYQGGISVIDFTNPSKPVEVGYFDRGPLSAERLVLGGSWSTYFYNGRIYSNDIQQGLDIFKLSDSVAGKANGVKLPYLNVQTQGPLSR